MKTGITIILLFVAKLCSANMASPIREGTLTSAAFTSKDINILSETIRIKIDKDFKTASFIVEYTIQSDITGKQIPLLFYAQDYRESFLVWVDNKSVAIQNIPGEYTDMENSPFSGFSHAFEKNRQANNTDEISIYWQENSSTDYKFKDLKYFETDITKGTHTVRVAYTANAWKDLSGWTKKYSFRYSLTPAKFWKSFGNLTIHLQQAGTVRELSTNIGRPLENNFETKNTWTFNKLPAEFLDFSYTPAPGSLATALITIEPLGLSILAGIMLFILHLIIVRRYRIKFVSTKYSPVVFWGSVIVCFLIFLSYMFSYSLIDNIIGEDASRNHGYIFLIFIFYPLLLPIYWTIVWLLDKQQKSKLMKA